MKRAILIVVAALSCTNPDRAKSTLKAEGFTNIIIGGYAATECGHGDDTCTEFEATSPGGTRVHGAVGCGYDCGGLGKGCTVRISE